jgi:hypothetical protein
LAFDAAHKNKELNRIINSVRKIKVRFSLRWHEEKNELKKQRLLFI